MLSALPLEECADKAAADQRLQAMGAFVCVRVCGGFEARRQKNRTGKALTDHPRDTDIPTQNCNHDTDTV